jgi:Tfp pilus assembly protein PilF
MAKSNAAPGTTFPPEEEAELAPMIRRPGDMTLEEASRFVHVTPEDWVRPFAFDDDLSHFKWALATAESYRAIGLHLWDHERPDLLMVYIEAVDSTSHLFGHLFRAEGLAGELAAQQARFSGTVEEMYRYADGLVGDFLKVLEDNSTLVVLSDHGFELGAVPEDPSKTRDMRRVSERYHRLEGIVYLYGNHVKPHSRLDQPKQLDVTPTLLALAGLSPARDMPGRVWTEALDVPAAPRAVASYESGGPQAGEQTKDAAVDPAILERLRSLGYLDARSPQGDRNIAAMHFEAGRYAEAAQLYEQLVQQNPSDGGLQTSLAAALGALGRLDEALQHLDKAIELDPLNPESYHNRAVIYERQGKRDAAIAEYRQALRYRPQYEPSKDALVRLTGSAVVGQPKSDAERLAAAMAARASQSARRGDYAQALKTLDEAARIAPRYALIYHYRANVAYLMGDRDGAIAALRKALQIEPDNALFKTNLQRLEQRKP